MPQYSFVEFKNVGPTFLDLSGVKLTAGVAYTFPVGTEVRPGGYIVLARDERALKRVYRDEFGRDDVKPAGRFRWKLPHAGGVIAATSAEGEEFLRVSYEDRLDGADGDGYSLVPTRLNPARVGQVWIRSFSKGGSPGRPDVSSMLFSALFALLGVGTVGGGAFAISRLRVAGRKERKTMDAGMGESSVPRGESKVNLMSSEMVPVKFDAPASPSAGRGEATRAVKLKKVNRAAPRPLSYAGVTKYAQGDEVEAKYEDGEWYEAEIWDVLGDAEYTVLYTEYEETADVHVSSIRRRDSEASAFPWSKQLRPGGSAKNLLNRERQDSGESEVPAWKRALAAKKKPDQSARPRQESAASEVPAWKREMAAQQRPASKQSARPRQESAASEVPAWKRELDAKKEDRERQASGASAVRKQKLGPPSRPIRHEFEDVEEAAPAFQAFDEVEEAAPAFQTFEEVKEVSKPRAKRPKSPSRSRVKSPGRARAGSGRKSPHEVEEAAPAFETFEEVEEVSKPRAKRPKSPSRSRVKSPGRARAGSGRKSPDRPRTAGSRSRAAGARPRTAERKKRRPQGAPDSALPPPPPGYDS